MFLKGRRIILVTGVIAVLLTIAGAVLFFNARPKEKRVTVHLENAAFVDEPAFERTLQHLLGRAVMEANTIEIFENGEEIFPAKLQAIAGAEHSITLETYEFWGDEVPDKIIDALVERSSAGIAVHFIMDFVGSIGLDQEDLKRLEESGVDVVRWRKPSWYESSRFNHRTHRKLLVVDGRIGFTGGANLADPWQGTPETGGMRDNFFRFTGPVVGELQAAFMDNWLKATGELLLGEAYFPELQETGNVRAQTVVSSPREGTHLIRKLYLLAIAGARDHLRLGTAFFYPDDMVIEALLKARERGVEIDILAAGEETEKGWVRYASRNRWADLLEAGVRIHEYSGPMYHAKMVIVDQHFTSIGSSNMDNRSFRINDEVNVNVFDTDFTEQMIALFEEDLEDSITYDTEKWQDRSRWERVAGWFGNWIGPHL